MIKEKVIFWPLVALFIGILVFGLGSQGKKKEEAEGLLRDIETATKKTRAKVKVSKDMRDFDIVKAADTLDGYKFILKRSPFFRASSDTKVKKVEVVSIKEKPKEPVLKYKGRVIIDSKVKVIIEEEGTGKSFFVQEGDMAGDFIVLRIDEKEVALKKEGGEEIVLSVVKKEEKEEEEKKEVK